MNQCLDSSVSSKQEEEPGLSEKPSTEAKTKEAELKEKEGEGKRVKQKIKEPEVKIDSKKVAEILS